MRTLLLTLLICLIALPDIYAKYSGGTGDPNNPYQIATAEDLMLLGESPEDYDKHFIMTADIDLDPNLPGRKVFDRAVIAPDTDSNDQRGLFQGPDFTGVFNGNGYKILHLTIMGGSYLGLFGQLGGADVKNMGLVDVNILGSGHYVGGLAGSNEWGGIIEHCYSTGMVTGSYNVGGLVGVYNGNITMCYSNVLVSGGGHVGGLVGENWDSIIISHSSSAVSGKGVVGGLLGYNGSYGGSSVIQCYSTGSVTGEGGVGGLVGLNGLAAFGFSFFGSLTHCYSTAAVSGKEEVGGLVGSNVNGVIMTCYSIGSVSGNSSVGGLVGLNTDDVRFSYSTGQVSGTSDVGGLVGSNKEFLYGEGRVSNSFWDIQTSGQMTSVGGTGKSTSEMQTASTFLDAGWDFVDEIDNGTDDVWKIVEGQTYPLLSWQKYSGGTGEPNDPYQIATAEDLMLLGESPEDYDKHFILTADIDLDPNLPGRKVFDRAVIAPDTNDVESGFQGTLFIGVFDGNGRTISHLTITGDRFLGLFGQLDYGAAISDLGLEVIDINGTGEVGGLVGSNDGTITKSYSTGKVSGDYVIGGLVGVNDGSITDSYHSGSVSGTSMFVGGLVGSNVRGRITKSYSTGWVSGDQWIGGLVGMNGLFAGVPGASIVITSCYSTCEVSGTGYVGGLVGSNANCGHVIQCYSTGLVDGAEGVGGLVGSGSAVIDSFWDVETSGQVTSDGGTGKTTAEMQTASTFLDAGWDFVDEVANGTDDIWWILEGQDYPRLWLEAVGQ